MKCFGDFGQQTVFLPPQNEMGGYIDNVKAFISDNQFTLLALGVLALGIYSFRDDSVKTKSNPRKAISRRQRKDIKKLWSQWEKEEKK
jgi:hypothetical protein